MAKGKFYVGTSGWSYKDWKGVFYPPDLKSSEWLTFYSNSFNITEINSSFYHLPKKETVENWVKKVPKEFIFCPKMSRYLTHIKKLKEPEESLEKFFEIFHPMNKKMGPVLIQLPPSLKFNGETAEYLYTVLKNTYYSYQFAVEVRHNTWLAKNSIKLMKQYNIAYVISHSAVGFPYAEYITSRNIYFRFHGPKELYASSYSQTQLKKFATLFNSWLDQGHILWIFFNNDIHTYAINNALTLKKTLEHHTFQKSDKAY